MELDTRELFRYLARDCNYRDEKLCDVSKADCIARDYILLSKLRSSWRFLKFSEALHVYSNRNFYVRNHVSQTAKGGISNWDAIANGEWRNSNSVTSNVFSEIRPWLQTPMTRNSTVIMPIDIHKQAMSGSWIRKTSRENKGYEKRLETLFT